MTSPELQLFSATLGDAITTSPSAAGITLCSVLEPHLQTPSIPGALHLPLYRLQIQQY